MVWPALRDLATGRVVFTMPPEPAPCGATALKPLLMACDHWQRAGVLADLDVSLVLPRSSPIGVPSADDRLEAITWWVDRYALPQTYFRRILRGKVWVSRPWA